LCSDTSDRWINGLLYGHDKYVGPIGFAAESFHPNQEGQDAIARYFLAHYTDGHGGLLVGNPSSAGSALRHVSTSTSVVRLYRNGYRVPRSHSRQYAARRTPIRAVSR
jgi:hypothetical protein